MALVYNESHDGPGIHALIIGIGGYDHLEGGVGTKKIHPLSEYGNLGQLTSPPRSAFAMAGLFTDGKRNQWKVPIKTVDLLISCAPEDNDPTGSGTSYERPTREAIQVAFDEWFERCDTAEGNVAFFYFGGHGLEATNQVLLASDFGKFGNPWFQAIDFHKTRLAFKRCRAETQIFCVDACREITISTVETPDPSAPPLLEPKVRQPDHCKYDLTIRSTSRTLKAHGEHKDESYFAKAIKKAFEKGWAAEKKNGQWWITTGKIVERLERIMKLVGSVKPQKPAIEVKGYTHLYRLPGPPQEVVLNFGCSPSLATEAAELSYCSLPNGKPEVRPKRGLAPWRVPVIPGLYEIAASFPSGRFTNTQETVIVDPPISEETLRVT